MGRGRLILAAISLVYRRVFAPLISLRTRRSRLALPPQREQTVHLLEMARLIPADRTAESLTLLPNAAGIWSGLAVPSSQRTRWRKSAAGNASARPQNNSAR